jgi:hypothetical protein
VFLVAPLRLVILYVAILRVYVNYAVRWKHNMSPRHAAALILVGWYLMVPPMDNQGRTYATLPIKYWRLIRAFDSAKECEEFVEQFAEKARIRGEWYGVLKERTLSSRCVSTDDPRLNGK